MEATMASALGPDTSMDTATRRRDGTDAGEGLAAVGVTARHRPDALLFQEGDEAETCYRVLSGTIRLYRLLQDGRRHIVAFAGPGAFFAWDDEARHGFAAETVTEAVVVRYPRARLDALVAAQPHMAGRLLALARRELGSARAHGLMLGRKTATERLATFLIGLAADGPADGAADATGAILLALPMTRADIADHLGLTVETVSRCFSQLRRDGLLTLEDQRRCRLLRPAELGAIAEGQTAAALGRAPCAAIAGAASRQAAAAFAA
jgi:CRP-like cAMP-binding protein